MTGSQRQGDHDARPGGFFFFWEGGVGFSTGSRPCILTCTQPHLSPGHMPGPRVLVSMEHLFMLSRLGACTVGPQALCL